MTLRNTRSGEICSQGKVGYTYSKVFEKSNNNLRNNVLMI